MFEEVEVEIENDLGHVSEFLWKSLRNKKRNYILFMIPDTTLRDNKSVIAELYNIKLSATVLN